jgi:hypothetical protein
MRQFGRYVDHDWKQRRVSLKSLFREVAKRVHPDLTSDETDRQRRGRLMAEANCAFEKADANRLTKILEECAPSAEAVDGAEGAEDLVGAARKVALKVRLHVTFLERFDQMKQHRALLAQHFLTKAPGQNIPEQMIHFFEEMWLLLQDSYVDEELIWSTFGFSAIRWWALYEDYVVEERKRRNDDSLFTGFESLAARFSKRDSQAGFQDPTVTDLIVFLEAEQQGASS